MKRLLFLAVLFCGVLSFAQPASDADVVKAFRLAYQGELTDAPLVHGLETRFREKRSLKDQITTAYLMTFAPRRLLRDPRSQYVNFVLVHPEAKEIVDNEALFRLYRMRADEWYDEGKFDAALADLRELLKATNPQVRDYATLKIGWTYLNTKRPEAALVFWQAETEKLLANAAPVSPNLAHGLGLALVENKRRSSQDIDKVLALPLEPALKHQLALGVDEGLEELTKEEDVRAFTAALSKCPGKQPLIQDVVENTKASGARACRYLPIVEISDLAWSSQGKLVESCAQWAIHSPKEKTAVQKLPEIEKLLAGKSLAGAERRVRFETYQVNKKVKEACAEGMAWLSELKTDKKAAAVKDIKTNCLAATSKWNESERVGFIANLSEAANAGEMTKSDDPFLFITIATLENSDMRKALRDTLLQANAALGKTLLPSILAESLKKHHEPAGALLANYGEQSNGTVRDESVWHELLTEEISSLVAKKEFSEAFSKLEKSLPLSDTQKSSEDTTELYLSVIVKSKETKGLESRSQDALRKMVANEAALAYPKLTPAILELSGEMGLWDTAWKIIENKRDFAKLASPRFKVSLYEAIATGAFSPPATTLKDSELDFVVGMGAATKNRDAAAFQKLKAQGKSPLVADLTLFQGLEKKKQQLLGNGFRSKDRITQVTAWVQFMDSEMRKIEKHRWGNQELYRVTNESLADFCTEAKSLLGKMNQVSKHKADSEESWKSFTPVLSQRLEQCEKRKKS